MTVAGAKPLAPGRHELKFKFDYDGGGRDKGGALRFLLDGAEIGSDHIPASLVFFTLNETFLNETFNVGLDSGSPAVEYPVSSPPGCPARISRSMR